MERSETRNIRGDGWTAERQLRFLDALASTRSVTRAAVFAGMSRESAYRLRNRPHGALLAILWDRLLEYEPGDEGHNRALGDGRLARLLGNHFRRQSGDFQTISAAAAGSARE